MDLAMRIDVRNPECILDVGCGAGNSTAILKKRWPEAEITGIDNSGSMLRKAREDHPDMRWIEKDITQDMSDLGSFDIIFSNAVLQWIPDVGSVLNGLFGMLRPDGVLAFQVPYAEDLPTHIAMRTLFARPEWKRYYDAVESRPRYRSMGCFYDILSSLSPELSLWQTEYVHVMKSIDDIADWNRASALRPFLDELPDDRSRDDFMKEYTSEIGPEYGVKKNGRVLYPFTRSFFILRKI